MSFMSIFWSYQMVRKTVMSFQALRFVSFLSSFSSSRSLTGLDTMAPQSNCFLQISQASKGRATRQRSLTTQAAFGGARTRAPTQSYICRDCGYIYDERQSFESQDKSYRCPVCNSPKRRYGKPCFSSCSPTLTWAHSYDMPKLRNALSNEWETTNYRYRCSSWLWICFVSREMSIRIYRFPQPKCLFLAYPEQREYESTPSWIVHIRRATRFFVTSMYIHAVQAKFIEAPFCRFKEYSEPVARGANNTATRKDRKADMQSSGWALVCLYVYMEL